MSQKQHVESSLQKGWALITGGSSGMGLEYARQLAAQGYDLLLVSNQQAELEQAKNELLELHAVRVATRCQDLATTDAADQLLSFCQQEGIGVDVLINNAGMFFFGELGIDDEPRISAMLRLHVFTPSQLCIKFGEQMKQRRHGYILNVSSMTAQLPCPGITLYSATKAYLKSFGKSLYFEMRPYGVAVTTVCPAAIATPLYRLGSRMLRLGVKTGLIRTPKWLVRRALRGLFRKRRVVKPGLMNYIVPALIAILPNWLVAILWRKCLSAIRKKS